MFRTHIHWRVRCKVSLTVDGYVPGTMRPRESTFVGFTICYLL